MKRTILCVLSLALLAVSSVGVFADETKNLGPEIINLKMGNMDLKFEHRKHQTSAKNDCYNCHKTKIGQIDGWGRETAHRICIPCHDLENKGPVLCQGCHEKQVK